MGLEQDKQFLPRSAPLYRFLPFLSLFLLETCPSCIRYNMSQCLNARASDSNLSIGPAGAYDGWNSSKLICWIGHQLSHVEILEKISSSRLCTWGPPLSHAGPARWQLHRALSRTLRGWGLIGHLQGEQHRSHAAVDVDTAAAFLRSPVVCLSMWSSISLSSEGMNI